MITNKKVFGAYVLSKHNLDVEDSNDKNDVASDYVVVERPEMCSIPPSWTALELVNVQPYNKDTSIFKFRLPPGKKRLNLPVGAFMLIKAPNCEHDGGDAVRPYTSISDDDVENTPEQDSEPTEGEGLSYTVDHRSISIEKIGRIVNETTSNADAAEAAATKGADDTAGNSGTFDMLCKRYDQWGMKESIQTHFLFTKTDHSYRPAGAVSNYIHKLKVSDTVEFKCKRVVELLFYDMMSVF